MDDEGVEHQKKSDGSPFVVVVVVEVDEGEEVTAHVAARQQGVEDPEGENLQHHNCDFDLSTALAAALGHTLLSCETLDSGKHYRSLEIPVGRGGGNQGS